MSESETAAGVEVRPRFGRLDHGDGTSELVVFHPHPHRPPGTFICVRASNQRIVTTHRDDMIIADAMVAGQSIETFACPRAHNWADHP